MEKTPAEQYLDGDIEVDEYTAAVIAEAELMASQDLTNREQRLLESLGSSSLAGNT